MSRPVDADAEATRRRILQSALRLFSAHGPDGTSIRDIARASDVSLAMVHHYFGSKDGLYVACVDSMYAELAELRSELESAISAGGAVSQAVESAVRAGFRFARAHQTAVRLLLRSVIEAGELDARRRNAMQIPFLENASKLLGGLLDRKPDELRLPIQSVVALTARYAVSSKRELELLANGRSSVVEDHLVATAHAVLGLNPPEMRNHASADSN